MFEAFFHNIKRENYEKNLVLYYSYMLGKSFADGHVIKAEKSMLYFAGLYPSYLLYLQGDIPENTKIIGLIKKNIGLF